MIDLRQSKQWYKWILIIGLILIASTTLYQATQPRTIVSVNHINGSSLLVVQTYDAPICWDTSIYFDDGSGRWRWYYFEHEDLIRWGGRIQTEDDLVRVSWNDGEILFDTSNGDCKTRYGSKFRSVNKSATIKNRVPLNSGSNFVWN